MLILHAADLAVYPSPDYCVRGQKAEDLEVPSQFLGIPHPAVLGHQDFTATGRGVDLHKTLAAIGPVGSDIGLAVQEKLLLSDNESVSLE